MTETELLLEIGSEAYADLDPREIAALCNKYSAAHSRKAGLHAFQLLKKKFMPSYRMGKTYEALSEKFEAYTQVYNWYCATVSAGTITATDDEMEAVTRDKFVADEN